MTTTKHGVTGCLIRLVWLLAVTMALGFCAAAAEADEELSLVCCEEQDFSTLSSVDYGQQFVEGEGMYVYTRTYDSIPYVLIQKANYCGTDTEDYFNNYFSPKIENKYGSDLLGEIEYGSFETGGKALAGVRYIYRLQNYVIHMIHLVEVRDDADVYYTAKFQQDEEEVTLAALDSMVANYRPSADAYVWKEDETEPRAESTGDTGTGGDGSPGETEGGSGTGGTGTASLPGGVSASGKIGFLERLGEKKEREKETGNGTETGTGTETETGTGTGTGTEAETENADSTGYNDDNTAREPPPKSTELTQLGAYEVTKVESPLWSTGLYEDDRFSLYIPKGWVVETTGVYSSLVIKVYDPQVPDRSISLFCGIYPFLRSSQAQAWYEANQSLLEPQFRIFKDAPVMGSLSVTYFLTTLEDLRTFCGTYFDSGLTWNPELIPAFGRYRVAEMWDSNILAFDECADKSIIRLFYDSPQSGRDCSALVTAQITEGESWYAGDVDIGFNSVYAFTCLTAPTEEIGQMMGTMIRLLSSLSFTETFLTDAMTYDELRPEILSMMPEVLTDVQDQFNRKWDTRDITAEVEANRRIDEEQGLIRLVDTEKEEIFLADRAFYEAYDADRASYERQSLYPVSEVDEQYYVWAVKYRIGG